MTKQSEAEKNPHTRVYVYWADKVTREKIHMNWRDAKNTFGLVIFPPEGTEGLIPTEERYPQDIAEKNPHGFIAQRLDSFRPYPLGDGSRTFTFSGTEYSFCWPLYG